MTSLKKLLFASHNPNKVEEMRILLPAGYVLTSLTDIQWSREIPEPYNTFEENALVKASFVFQHTGIPCFADDSGLEIDTLDGRPGVLSARYAGPNKNSTDNMNKIVEELRSTANRSARFVAVIAYRQTENDFFLFTGMVEGSISSAPLGQGGFGYDPVFIPSGFDQTFGQLHPRVKNLISHRAKAMSKFLGFLKHH